VRRGWWLLPVLLCIGYVLSSAADGMWARNFWTLLTGLLYFAAGTAAAYRGHDE